MLTKPTITKTTNRRAIELDIGRIDRPDYARELVPANVAVLKESIPIIGLIHPITVSPNGDRFDLIAGGTRLQAMTELGEKQISSFVLDGGLSRDQLIAISLNENTSRRNEPLSELMRRVELLQHSGKYSHAEAAALAVIEEGTLSKVRLIIGEHPEESKTLLEEHDVGLSVAYEIANRANDPEQIVAWTKAYVAGEISRDDITAVPTAKKKSQRRSKTRLDLGNDLVDIKLAYLADEDAYDKIDEAMKAAIALVAAHRRRQTPPDLLPRLLMKGGAK